MPIVLFDADFNETPYRPGESPMVEVRFGAGDTRVQRVWVGAEGVSLRVYAALPIPVGTVANPNGPNAAKGTPAVVLSFPDAASARLVLEFWLANLNAAAGAVPAAVRIDPRYAVIDPYPPDMSVPDATTWDTGDFTGLPAGDDD